MAEMDENDPRRDSDLLRPLGPTADFENASRLTTQPRRPPERARCEKCGGGDISSIPTFSVGSGSASRAFADDVMCHRCGHIGLFKIE